MSRTLLYALAFLVLMPVISTVTFIYLAWVQQWLRPLLP